MKHPFIPLLISLALPVGAAEIPSNAPDQPMERIGIRPGEREAEFYLKNTGATFHATGFNYIRLRAAEGVTGGDHSTFDADTRTTKSCYDGNRAEAMFSALGKAGYNTVRIFVIGRTGTNPGIAGDYDTTKSLYEPYMENVLDFLRRATRHGIRVFPALGDGELPNNAHYRERLPGKGHNKNASVLTAAGVDARVENITSFLSYIKNKEPALLPTLLGLQCQNEACLHADQWPFTENSGAFIAANGKTYDLAKTEERQALMDESYRHYHERIIAAVKAIDPEMLVAEGVFVPRAVGTDPAQHAGLWSGKKGDDRYPPTLAALGQGKLDFLDVHFYRTRAAESVEQAWQLDLTSTGFFTAEMIEARKTKPVIMGEFGAFDSVEKTFEDAVNSMTQVRDLAQKERLNGMLYWTFDCSEQPSLHHAATNWTLFVEKMGNFPNAPRAGNGE